MKQYHVNPTTGDPAVCHAESGNCPFGTHTLNPSDCRALYERVMAAYTIPKPIRRRGLVRSASSGD